MEYVSQELTQRLFLACRTNDIAEVQSIIPGSILPTTKLHHTDLYGMRFVPRGGVEEETNCGYDSAAYSGRIDGVCTYYTDKDGGSKFFSDHFLPLFFAAAGGHTECVDYILSCDGSLVDGCNDSGITALMVALTCGEGKMANHLILRGAKLSSTISGTLALPHMRGISAGDLLVMCVTRGEVCIANAVAQTTEGVAVAPPRSTAPLTAASNNRAAETWTCLQCTLVNSYVLRKCELCDYSHSSSTYWLRNQSNEKKL
jgi:hypothetical protein